MTFSYSGDPGNSDLDEVRFYIQDTDELDALISDEEIHFVVSKWSDVIGTNLWAAAMCCEILAARFAREVAVSADGVSVGVEALQEKYNQLAMSLRDSHKTFVGSGGSPVAGGTLFDEYFDPSIKPLSFWKGMHDNIAAGEQQYGGRRNSNFSDKPADAI